VTYLSLVSLSLLLLVQMLIGRMHFLGRDSWRSVGAGVAISYVFLDILPHLASKQSALQDRLGGDFETFLAHHVYLLALAGFILYFCLARVARTFRTSRADEPERPHATVSVLVLALAGYCFVIGYLIGEQPDHRYEPVIIFTVAVTIHLAGVGHTVHDHYAGFYDRIYRYVFAGATLAGWLLGIVTMVPDIVFVLVFSFVVGVIMIVAFMYELPVVMRGGSYGLFAAGAAGFSALLLIYEALAKVDLSA